MTTIPIPVPTGRGRGLMVEIDRTAWRALLASRVFGASIGVLTWVNIRVQGLRLLEGLRSDRGPTDPAGRVGDPLPASRRPRISGGAV